MNRIPIYTKHWYRDAGGVIPEQEYIGMPLAAVGSSVKPPPCVIAHGAGVRNSGVIETYGGAGWEGVSQLFNELSQEFTVAMPLLGGDLWGNPTHVSRVSSAISYLNSIGSSGPVTLVCYSMGHTGMANVANSSPSSVRCLIAIEGVQDIQNMYTRFPGPGPGGFSDDIDSAYPGGSGGSNGWIARSPINLASSLASAEIPICQLFASNDSVVLPSTTRVFVSNYVTAADPSYNLASVWPFGNSGSSQNGTAGKLWWKDVGALDHSDAAILAGTDEAIQFARYLTL